MSPGEKIGLIICVVMIGITTLLQLWLHYTKYKIAQISMERNLVDMNEKQAAFNTKYPMNADQMEHFREQHHDYVLEREKIERAQAAKRDAESTAAKIAQMRQEQRSAKNPESNA